MAACTALGEIARNGALLIPAEGEGFTKLSTVENLLARITSGKESTKVSWESTKGSGCCDILMFISCVYCVYAVFFLRVLMIRSFNPLVNNLVTCVIFMIFSVCPVHVCDPDEGAVDPEFGLPASGRWRLPSPEEVVAGTHGLCRGKKIVLTDSSINISWADLFECKVYLGGQLLS